MSEVSPLTIKDSNWYIHDFLKAVGNNVRASFPINATIIAYFWYFNNDIFSVILPLAFDNDNVSLIQIFSYTPEFFSLYYFFCVQVKSGFLYQNLYWKSINLLKNSNSLVRNGSFNEMLISKNKRVSFYSEKVILNASDITGAIFKVNTTLNYLFWR